MTSPIARLADDAARALLTPPAGLRIDFAQPSGEAALMPADGVSWRIFKNPVALYVGGIAAVVMEFAEPRVRDGVWQHSTFRTRPLDRLKRTGLAAMVTVYGARSTAEAMIAGVVRRHDRVRGATTEGEAYHANDPELLDWVQATATFGFSRAYDAYVRPLTDAERDAAFAEAVPAAALYGAVGAPRSEADFEGLMAGMLPRFRPSPVVSAFLDIMARMPGLPWFMRPLRGPLLRAAVAIVPEAIRARLEIGEAYRLAGWQRRLVVQAARAADRLVLPSSPAVQACRRLGLAEDYLYRRA